MRSERLRPSALAPAVPVSSPTGLRSARGRRPRDRPGRRRPAGDPRALRGAAGVVVRALGLHDRAAAVAAAGRADGVRRPRDGLLAELRREREVATPIGVATLRNDTWVHPASGTPGTAEVLTVDLDD
jgi:hypothetical protein